MKDMATQRAVGREEGRVDECRRLIVMGLHTRVGALPSWIEPRLTQENDLEQLERIFRATTHMETVADLESFFGRPRPRARERPLMDAEDYRRIIIAR